MNILSFKFLHHQRTLLVSLICMLFFVGVVLYQTLEKKHANDVFRCNATLQINHQDSVFRGVIEYKSGIDKGIVNISGFVTLPDKKEYTIQRTVFFIRDYYGVSPVLESKKIIISNQENAPQDSLKYIIPDFYLKSSEVTDIDIIPLDKGTHLITKAGVPYLFCNTSIHVPH